MTSITVVKPGQVRTITSIVCDNQMVGIVQIFLFTAWLLNQTEYVAVIQGSQGWFGLMF